MSLQACIIERNKAIQNIHKRIIHSGVNRELINNDLIVSIILEEPAPRFYITPIRAKQLIIAYYNKNFEVGNVKKTRSQEMIEDLIANYERLRDTYPHTPKEKIYEMVVEQPAKSFYMSFSRMKDVIFNWRNGPKSKRPK